MNRFDIEVEGSHNYFADGVMVHNSPETTTGGKALKFYASVRLDVRRIETLKDGTDAVGNRTRVKVVKNKVSPPFKQAEFDILYGKGISKEGSLIDMGVEQGFIRKSGSWFTYEGEQLGQGKENARNFLIENPDAANEIEKKIKEKLGIGAVVTDDGPMTSCPPRRLLSRGSSPRGAGAGAVPAPAHRAGAHPGRARRPADQARLPRRRQRRGARPACRTSGLVDDADFAEQWVRSRRVNAGKGKRALAAELRTKGVDDEVITAALADIDAGAERERAEQLVGDKLRRERLGDDDDTKVMRRLVGMLARRGYHQSMASTSSRPNWPASGNAAGSSGARGQRSRRNGRATWRPGQYVCDWSPNRAHSFTVRRARLPARSSSGSNGVGARRDRRSRPSSHAAKDDSAKLTADHQHRDDDQRGNVVAVRRADAAALPHHLEERDLVADRGVLQHHHQLRDQHGQHRRDGLRQQDRPHGLAPAHARAPTPPPTGRGGAR